MLNYDFTILSPPEFEEFSRDIIQEHLDITFESFKDGKDGGIDFRYSIDKKNTILIQCKRYSDYKTLLKELKNELKKVEKLIPERYILVTSVDLSVGYKKEILKLFGQYIKNTSDIIGKGDLNNFLSKYNHLEQKYYKLWLSSTTIMNKIINSDIYNRSNFTEEEIKNEVSLYVQNESYEEALQILEKNNYIVISGIPGIGKSTLAKMLIYNYLTKGYGLVEVSKDIDEADKLFIEGKKQVFFYDDFLGRVFLNKKLGKNEESRIVQFLRKVRKDSTKKLVMTTREYILQQAKIEYQEFEKLQSSIIDLRKYNDLIKAKILYNHLFFLNIPQSYITYIIGNDNYLKIINHKNYNPRLIENLTLNYDMYSDKEEEYFYDFIKMLDNPKELWKNPFEKHIEPVSRYLLYVLLQFGESVDIDYLKRALENLITIESKRYTVSYQRNDFNNSIQELNRSFIKIEHNLVSFQNPSIEDFLLNYLSKDNDMIISLVKSSICFEQLFTIFQYRLIKTRAGNSRLKDKVLIDGEIVQEFESQIISRFDMLELLPDKFSRMNEPLLTKLTYISRFFNLEEKSSIKDFFISKLKTVDLLNLSNASSNEAYSRFSTYLNLLIFVENEITLDKEDFVVEFIELFNSIDDIDDLLLLEKKFPEEFNEFKVNAESQIESIIESEINSIHDDDLDEMNDLKDKIEDIESQFGFNLFYVSSNLDDKIEELEEKLEEEEEVITKDRVMNKKSINTRDEIVRLFKTLKK